MRDSTRIRLMQSCNDIIPWLEDKLTKEIIPLINNSNYKKFEIELEIALIFLVMNLDFYANVKNYLNRKCFWEGIVALKQLYKITFESFNKIAYKTIKEKNGDVNIDATEKMKKESLWLSKMEQFVNEENEPEYKRISELLIAFKTNNDFDYITKIRNHDGHYSGMVKYIKDMQAIDPDKLLNLAIDWGEIMNEVNKFTICHLNKKISNLSLD